MPFDGTTLPEALKRPGEKACTAKARAALYRAGAFFLAHPEAHTKKVTARDKKGCHISALDPAAVQWCAAGRICFELRSERANPASNAAFDLVLAELKKDGTQQIIPHIITWNDKKKRTPEEVAHLLMRAAQKEISHAV